MANILNGFDGYMVLDDDRTSDLISIGHTKNFAIQVVVTGVTGSAVGTIDVEVSNDKTNWIAWFWQNMDGASDTDGYAVNNTDFTRVFNFIDVGAGWARVKYDRKSGTGGLNFYINSKK